VHYNPPNIHTSTCEQHQQQTKNRLKKTTTTNQIKDESTKQRVTNSLATLSGYPRAHNLLVWNDWRSRCAGDV